MKSLKAVIAENTPEAKTAKEYVKRLDDLADKVESLEKQYTNKVSGKGAKALYKLGLNDSISHSEMLVKDKHGRVTDAFEELQMALSDLANGIDNYHL